MIAWVEETPGHQGPRSARTALVLSFGTLQGVSETVFLSWFDYDLIYVVLCSTNKEFVVEDFTKNRLPSHIARRKILTTKNEMKRNGRNFRLAHTKYEG
jgi:hypothetical protein